jgi:hypothetical protein
MSHCQDCADRDRRIELLETKINQFESYLKSETEKFKLAVKCKDKIEAERDRFKEENNRLREALGIALREWKMYIEESNCDDLDSIDDTENIEVQWYKQTAEALEGK